jgi:hypothetical protein
VETTTAKIRTEDGKEQEVQLTEYNEGKWRAVSGEFFADGVSRAGTLKALKNTLENKSPYLSYTPVVSVEATSSEGNPLSPEERMKQAWAAFSQHVRNFHHFPARTKVGEPAPAEKFIPRHEVLIDPTTGKAKKDPNTGERLESDKTAGGYFATTEKLRIPRLGQEPPATWFSADMLGPDLTAAIAKMPNVEVVGGSVMIHAADRDPGRYVMDEKRDVTQYGYQLSWHAYCTRCAVWAIWEPGDEKNPEGRWTGPLVDTSTVCSKSKKKDTRRYHERKPDKAEIRYTEAENTQQDRPSDPKKAGMKILKDLEPEDIQAQFRERDRVENTQYGMNWNWQEKTKGFDKARYTTKVDMIRDLTNRGLTSSQIMKYLTSIGVPVYNNQVAQVTKQVEAEKSGIVKMPLPCAKWVFIAAAARNGYDARWIHSNMALHFEGCEKLSYQYVWKIVKDTKERIEEERATEEATEEAEKRVKEEAEKQVKMQEMLVGLSKEDAEAIRTYLELQEAEE